MVNQQINRNLRTIPYFPVFWSVTLRLGNQLINREMTHTLGKIWVLILGQWRSGWEINGSTGFCALYLIITRTVAIVSQHINRVLNLLLGKFEIYSRSVMGRMVNQQINRNMSAMPNFSSDCFTFQSTYQRGISLALGKIWALFSVSDGHFGKSTDQQESAHHTLFSGFLVSDTETGQSTDQRGNDAHTGKIWVLILGQWCSGW